jgi:hypothetical protein
MFSMAILPKIRTHHQFLFQPLCFFIMLIIIYRVFFFLHICFVSWHSCPLECMQHKYKGSCRITNLSHRSRHISGWMSDLQSQHFRNLWLQSLPLTTINAVSLSFNCCHSFPLLGFIILIYTSCYFYCSVCLSFLYICTFPPSFAWLILITVQDSIQASLLPEIFPDDSSPSKMD